MNDNKPEGKPRGGRPWSFDRDAALATAMELFWRRGFEGVSISDLTKAIGVAPPSLYAAFGSKAELYCEVLDRYAAAEGSLDAASVEHAASLREGVASVLRAAVTTVGNRGQACMISGGMLACRPEHDALAGDLARRRAAFEGALQAVFTRWLDSDEATSLARYLTAVMQGISIHARDGATATELQNIADVALKAVPLS